MFLTDLGSNHSKECIGTEGTPDTPLSFSIGFTFFEHVVLIFYSSVYKVSFCDVFFVQ